MLLPKQDMKLKNKLPCRYRGLFLVTKCHDERSLKVVINDIQDANNLTVNELDALVIS